MSAMQNPIIAALDVPIADQALQLARQIAPAVGAFKIGGELFTAAGPDIVRRVRDTGAAVGQLMDEARQNDRTMREGNTYPRIEWNASIRLLEQMSTAIPRP